MLLRFKLADKELKIEQVVSVTEEKIVGNKMLCFRCQSEINGRAEAFFKLDVNQITGYKAGKACNRI